MSDVKKIVSSIQDAVDALGSSAEIKQDALFKELIGLTKTLETRGDVLLNNIKNLGIINKIKVKLERLIIDPKYKEDVKKFIGSYSDIQDLSNQYFSQFNAKYKPSATANGVKQTAIDSTLNGLFENGINTGVIDGLKKILQTNISAGGSYAHLTEQLRNYMLTNDTGDGALKRYVKTYANTAINQFTAEYNKTISDDLGLEWFGYDGSLLTTSREFCDKCVEKKYIHISEFPAIIAGNFGALGEIHITKSTGLPDGMMAGTDETNLVRRRGGWNCGHQMIAVAESVVPQNIRDAVYATQAYKNWAAKNGKVAKEVIPVNPDKVENAKGIQDKLNEAKKAPEKITMAVLPFTKPLIDKLFNMAKESKDQKFLKEIINDADMKLLDLGLKSGGFTKLHLAHNTSGNGWQREKEIAKDLNNQNVDVGLLPEDSNLSSPDAIILLKNKWRITDLKYSESINSGTISDLLKQGFAQTGNNKNSHVTIKLTKANSTVFAESIYRLIGKEMIIADITLINRYGKKIDLKREMLTNGKFLKQIKGFL